jgi:hypothetical protein
MSASSNDSAAPDAKPASDTVEPSPAEKPAEPAAPRRGQSAQLTGKALTALAALAAAGASQADAAVPTPSAERAYLEALLQGSWTEPPDLSLRRLPQGKAADASSAGLDAVADQGFNDTNNPNPRPYSDRTYADSGFGDRN